MPRFEVDCSLFRPEATTALFSPVSGTVVEVNEALIDKPGLINENPFENWIIKVELSAPNELDELLNADEYASLLEG